jgi:hypothetical protein
MMSAGGKREGRGGVVVASYRHVFPGFIPESVSIFPDGVFTIAFRVFVFLVQGTGYSLAQAVRT